MLTVARRRQVKKWELERVFRLYTQLQYDTERGRAAQRREKRQHETQSRFRAALLRGQDKVTTKVVDHSKSAGGGFGDDKLEVVEYVEKGKVELANLGRVVALRESTGGGFGALSGSADEAESPAFADAINEGYFYNLLRDCALFPSTLSHQRVHEIFVKHAVSRRGPPPLAPARAARAATPPLS